LIPRQYSTGGRPILGRLSKRGSKYLRSLFIQAANVILMRPKTWGKFSLGAWLTAASPRMHRNKLAAALANKLARIAWSVLRPPTPAPVLLLATAPACSCRLPAPGPA
jgi:transposase